MGRHSFSSGVTEIVFGKTTGSIVVKRNVISHEMCKCTSPVHLMVHHISVLSHKSEKVKMSRGQLNGTLPIPLSYTFPLVHIIMPRINWDIYIVTTFVESFHHLRSRIKMRSHDPVPVSQKHLKPRMITLKG